MLRDTIIALLIAFLVSAGLCPYAIPLLHRLNFGQAERELGPASHKKKAGTPTMGGIMFGIALLIGTLPFVKSYPMIIPVLLFTLAFGVIGFLDDYLKIRRHVNEGLTVKQKLLLQVAATAILAVWLSLQTEIGNEFLVPFTGTVSNGLLLDLGFLFIPAVFLIVLGTDNGTNFTDGLDGLCASVTIAVSVFFLAAALKEGTEVGPVIGAMIGGLMGFLLFNCYPAKVFMGDTGALAIGGFVASLALVMQMPLFIPIVGFIYFIEVVSVMLQVGYFKLTHGKRLFRMSPIHHHFELGGWSETRVVTVFTTVTVLLSLAAYLGLG